MLKRVSVVHSFLMLNNIPQYGSATFCLSIDLSMDIWLLMLFWLLHMNNITVNIHLRVFVWAYICSEQIVPSSKQVASSVDV